MTNKKRLKALINTITQTGLMFALMVILMIIESIFPPLPGLPPGVKLGLSNIVVMFSIFFIGKKRTFMLILLKVFFVFITRGATSFLLSLCGSLLSVLIMILLYTPCKNGKLSYLMLSISGALFHNIGQLIGAFIVLKSSAVFYYLPILIISGVVFGIVSGTTLKVIMPHLQKMKFTKI